MEGRDFSLLNIRPDSQPPVQWVPGHFPGGKTLTTHRHLVWRLMSGAVPTLTPRCLHFMLCPVQSTDISALSSFERRLLRLICTSGRTVVCLVCRGNTICLVLVQHGHPVHAVIICPSVYLRTNCVSGLGRSILGSLNLQNVSNSESLTTAKSRKLKNMYCEVHQR